MQTYTHIHKRNLCLLCYVNLDICVITALLYKLLYSKDRDNVMRSIRGSIKKRIQNRVRSIQKLHLKHKKIISMSALMNRLLESESDLKLLLTYDRSHIRSKTHKEICIYYASIIVAYLSMCKALSEEYGLKQYINLMRFDEAALSLLYLMSQGLNVQDTIIIHKDEFLARTLPHMRHLDSFGYKQRTCTNMRRCLIDFFNALHTQNKQCIAEYELFYPNYTDFVCPIK